MTKPASRSPRACRHAPGLLPLLLGSLLLLAGRAPPRWDPRRITARQVLLAFVLLLLVQGLVDAWWGEAPLAYEPWGLGWALAQAAWLALATWLAATILRRPVLQPALLVLLALATLWITLLLLLADPWIEAHPDLQPLLLAAMSLWVLRRAIDGLDPGSGWPRRSAAALGGALVVLAAHWQLPRIPLLEQDWTFAQAQWQGQRLPIETTETLMFEQARRIDAAVAGLKPQRPGQIDLYLLGFAGDASERVFAQEAKYAAELFARRFGADGRTLVLANDLRSPARQPLATLAGLRHALTGIAARMDTDEDLLLLWLTSHGSADHRLFVNLPPLDLVQIGPQQLRQALDDAGIRWRIVVVSACHSGGFIEALADPYTLVIAAARADRESFGCGPDSEITWFGRAFLVEAMNSVANPVQAFELARQRIEHWEREAGFPASLPQLSPAPLLEIRLARWLQDLQPGPAVAFGPDLDAAQADPQR